MIFIAFRISTLPKFYNCNIGFFVAVSCCVLVLYHKQKKFRFSNQKGGFVQIIFVVKYYDYGKNF